MARSSTSSPSGYRAAQLRARSVAGTLTDDAARRVLRAVEDYADTIARRLSTLPASTPAEVRAAATEASRIAREAASAYRVAATDAVATGRGLAFADVEAIWTKAGEQVARAAGVPAAAFGAIQTPGLTMAGAYEALGGGARTWRASLTAAAHASAGEVDAVVTAGLVNGVSPTELASRLLPYMKGAEAFERQFPAADARFKAMRDTRASLDPELQNAAFKMRSNALRIAYTEIHNARAEAELQAYALDPLIYAVQWELSPNRGSQTFPDVCNAYAANDFYGLGAGRYPLDAVPMPPHPRDRCERYPLARDPSEWHAPKPSNVKRSLPADEARVPSEAGAPRLTATQAAGVRKHLAESFKQLEQHAAPDAVRQLMRAGEQEAADVLSEVAAHRTLLAAIERERTSPVPDVPTTTRVGLVTFPRALTDDELKAAKLLVQRARGLSTTALKALQDMGAETTELEKYIAERVEKRRLANGARRAAKRAAPPAPKTPTGPTRAPAGRLGRAQQGPTGAEARAMLAKIRHDTSAATAALEAERVTLAGTLNTLTREEAAWSSRYIASYPRSAELRDVRRRIIEIAEQMRAQEAARLRLAEQVLRADTVSSVQVEYRSRFDAPTKAKFDRGIQRFREIVGHHLDDTHELNVVAERARRAFYRHTERTAHLNADATSWSVVVHELIHGAEQYNPKALLKRAVEFRARRAAGETPVKLRKLFPGSKYEADEITLKDHFGHAYAGKLYQYGGTGVDWATEILTMGVQALVEDPFAFAASDPDYFDFICEVLWGAQ